MSSPDHSESGERPSASDIAAQLCETDFLRLVATPDGDALAATGVLARVLDVPFQASVAWDSVGESEADVTVTVGRSDGDVAITTEPLSVRAFAVARALVGSDSAADSASVSETGVLALALAGVVAAERDPSAYADTVGFGDEAADIDSRPGVGIPTADVADGLAHTTLVHAPFSGDEAAATEVLSDINSADDTGRAVASMLAFSIVGESNTRASEAIERAIHPSVVATTEEEAASTPFATLAGYADVLDALARSWPGTGLALALGHDCYEAALDGWRGHAQTAHAAVRNADLSQYRDLVVADASGTEADGETIGTIARLVRDYRSPKPKPVVLAIADDAVAGTTIEQARAQRDPAQEQDVTSALADAMAAVGAAADATGRGQYGYAQLELATKRDAFIDAFREAL